MGGGGGGVELLTGQVKVAWSKSAKDILLGLARWLCLPSVFASVRYCEL